MKNEFDGKIRAKAGKEVYLMTAADEREYDVCKSLLEAYGIPVLKRQREAGGYLSISMGMNIYGVDIYVPEEYYNDAVELVKNTVENKEENNTESEIAIEQYHNKRLLYIWIIIGVFYFVPFFIWLIYTLTRK